MRRTQFQPVEARLTPVRFSPHLKCGLRADITAARVARQAITTSVAHPPPGTIWPF